MPWKGGTNRKEVAAPVASFARLRPLVAGENTDLEASFNGLAQALRKYGSKVRIHIRLIHDAGPDKMEHWEIEGGSGEATARRTRPKDADVLVVVRSEIWQQIARGQLAPYDALFAGDLRVGGNLDTAKRITQHLSDPAVQYVGPC